MGIAIRSQQYMSLRMPPIIWKAIVREKLVIHDLEDIDEALVKNMLEQFRNIDREMDAETFEMSFFENFTTITSDNRTVELEPGGSGRSVTFANRKEFCDKVQEYRLHEFDEQAAAVRQGITTIIPAALLNITTAAQ